ncbi:MAG: glycosyltransferase family 4 protein [Nostocaceae cyanobacterium]|nr:glycosyltransferase family 4 protein [Nostocaceae cyanobacterium]
MTIVFITPVGAMGGAERVLLTMLTTLKTAQPKLELHLIVGTDGVLVEEARNLGVSVKVLKLPDAFNKLGDSALRGDRKVTALLQLILQMTKIVPTIGQYLGELRHTLRELQPDLIHSNGIKSHILTALTTNRHIPLIWHVHDFYGARPLMARVLRWLSNRPKLAIAISQAVAADLQSTIPQLSTEVIYNAIDVNYFSPLEGNYTFSTSTNPLQVGLVATFARWKGHDIFLEAAASLNRNYPDLNVRFCIVGGAIYKTRGSQFSEQELRDKAALLGIADKVDFLGFQQNIVAVYRSLDIVVHASTQPEPFGLAIVEAMACGKPVIISQAGGAAELFTHNYDAIGVPSGEPIALASAILDLLNNPQKRQLLSKNARRTVEERFSHQRLGKQLLAVYKSVLCSK